MKSKSLRKFKIGFKQIVVEVAVGLLTTLILQVLSHFGYLPDKVSLFINIFLIAANVLLALSMLSWGIFYMIGWLIGSFIFLILGLLETWDIVLYIILPVVIIAGRIMMAVKKVMA